MDNEKNTANGGENTGKTFTQEEVNQIVSNRLKEEREKMKKEQDASLRRVSRRSPHGKCV